MSTMRIIQVIPVLVVGGLERVATSLTIALSRKGDHVIVCSAGRARDLTILPDELAAAGIEVVEIPRPRPEPRLLIASAARIARVIRAERPDVVHAHNPAAAVASMLARFLARRRSVAIVATFHGLASGETRHAARALRIAADVVVGIGPAATRELADAGFPEARLVTVANAVVAVPTRSEHDVRVEFGAERSELLVTVGRYTPEKNQRLLLDALAILGPRRPQLRALIVGLGPLEADLAAQIDTLGLSEVATLTGPRADAVDLIAAADILVSTSSREGLGLTLLEALAVGTPVVATAVGGVMDVLADGRAGLLVPPDDAAALAEAIERMLDDGALRDRLVAHGLEHVATNFDADAMVDGYRAAYSVAVSRRRRRPSLRRSGASSSK